MWAFASKCVRQELLLLRAPRAVLALVKSLLGICLSLPNSAVLQHLFHGHPFCLSEDSPTRLSQHTQGRWEFGGGASPLQRHSCSSAY